MTPDAAPLPVARGDWVATRPGLPFQVGRVRDCYPGIGTSGRTVLVDVVLYGTDGAKVGRATPAMGGPRAYEPAMEFGDWRRIERPDFPLERIPDHVPAPGDGGDGRVTLSWSFHPSVRPKADRERALVPARAAAVPVRAARLSDFDPEMEASARRLAAQALRDTARDVPAAAAILRSRAEALEAEADAMRPRSGRRAAP